MTPDELAELLDRERRFDGGRRIEDLTELTLADRLDFQDEERRFRGPL